MLPIIALFVVCAIYSTVRYVAFAPENLQNLPVFVLNKGLSMASALAFALAFWVQWRQSRGASFSTSSHAWFRAGLWGAFAHIPMSLAILRPSYFKEFFNGDRLSFNGELVFLFGAVTIAGFYLLTRQSWTPLQRWGLSLVTMLTLFAHTGAMGYARGLNINASHAYMPPMWLLSLIGIALGVAFLLLSRPQESWPSANPEV